MPRKSKNTIPTTEPEQPEPLRHIRLHVPDSMYRQLKHRLADSPPSVSTSSLIAELLDTALDLTA